MPVYDKYGNKQGSEAYKQVNEKANPPSNSSQTTDYGTTYTEYQKKYETPPLNSSQTTNQSNSNQTTPNQIINQSNSNQTTITETPGGYKVSYFDKNGNENTSTWKDYNNALSFGKSFGTSEDVKSIYNTGVKHIEQTTDFGTPGDSSTRKIISSETTYKNERLDMSNELNSRYDKLDTEINAMNKEYGTITNEIKGKKILSSGYISYINESLGSPSINISPSTIINEKLPKNMTKGIDYGKNTQISGPLGLFNYTYPDTTDIGGLYDTSRLTDLDAHTSVLGDITPTYDPFQYAKPYEPKQEKKTIGKNDNFRGTFYAATNEYTNNLDPWQLYGKEKGTPLDMSGFKLISTTEYDIKAGSIKELNDMTNNIIKDVEKNNPISTVDINKKNLEENFKNGNINEPYYNKLKADLGNKESISVPYLNPKLWDKITTVGTQSDVYPTTPITWAGDIWSGIGSGIGNIISKNTPSVKQTKLYNKNEVGLMETIDAPFTAAVKFVGGITGKGSELVSNIPGMPDLNYYAMNITKDNYNPGITNVNISKTSKSEAYGKMGKATGEFGTELGFLLLPIGGKTGVLKITKFPTAAIKSTPIDFSIPSLAQTLKEGKSIKELNKELATKSEVNMLNGNNKIIHIAPLKGETIRLVEAKEPNKLKTKIEPVKGFETTNIELPIIKVGNKQYTFEGYVSNTKTLPEGTTLRINTEAGRIFTEKQGTTPMPFDKIPKGSEINNADIYGMGEASKLTIEERLDIATGIIQQKVSEIEADMFKKTLPYSKEYDILGITVANRNPKGKLEIGKVKKENVFDINIENIPRGEYSGRTTNAKSFTEMNLNQREQELFTDAYKSESVSAYSKIIKNMTKNPITMNRLDLGIDIGGIIPTIIGKTGKNSKGIINFFVGNKNVNELYGSTVAKIFDYVKKEWSVTRTPHDVDLTIKGNGQFSEITALQYAKALEYILKKNGFKVTRKDYTISTENGHYVDIHPVGEHNYGDASGKIWDLNPDGFKNRFNEYFTLSKEAKDYHVRPLPIQAMRKLNSSAVIKLTKDSLQENEYIKKYANLLSQKWINENIGKDVLLPPAHRAEKDVVDQIRLSYLSLIKYGNKYGWNKKKVLEGEQGINEMEKDALKKFNLDPKVTTVKKDIDELQKKYKNIKNGVKFNENDKVFTPRGKPEYVSTSSPTLKGYFNYKMRKSITSKNYLLTSLTPLLYSSPRSHIISPYIPISPYTYKSPYASKSPSLYISKSPSLYISKLISPYASKSPSPYASKSPSPYISKSPSLYISKLISPYASKSPSPSPSGFLSPKIGGGFIPFGGQGGRSTRGSQKRHKTHTEKYTWGDVDFDNFNFYIEGNKRQKFSSMKGIKYLFEPRSIIHHNLFSF